MSREEFHRELHRLSIGMDVDEIASRAMASRTTVLRWLDGTATPHRLGRESALAALRPLPVREMEQQQ